MATSSIDKELIVYFMRLNVAQKKSLLQMMKTFLQANNEKAGISIEQYNRELDEAMERVSRGEFTSLEDLEKEMQSW